MRCDVIIAAAGAGKRFTESGGERTADPFGEAAPPRSKVELDLGGKPVFLRSIELFLRRPGQVGNILLAVNPDAIDEFRFKWNERIALHDIQLIPGGRAERWETIANALKHIGDDATHVAVHDAARPLASRALIDRLFDAADRFDAVVPGLPVANTLKRVEGQPVADDRADPLDAILGEAGKPANPVWRVIETVPRTDLMEVQTPQVFTVDLLRRAYAQIADGKVDPTTITDDAGLIEALGESVHIVEGEATNLKITRAADTEFAAALIAVRDKAGAKELASKRLFANDDDD